MQYKNGFTVQLNLQPATANMEEKVEVHHDTRPT